MLNGKIALITGANSSIGSAVAKRLAFEGASLILTSKSLPALNDLNDEVKKMGQEPILVQLDLLDEQQVHALCASVENTFGKLDIMIASHLYTGSPSLLVDCSYQELLKLANLNFCANFNLIKCFDQLCKLSDCARMVFVLIASLADKKKSSFAPYFASQEALIHLLEDYAQEISHTEIKVNAIALEEYKVLNGMQFSTDFTDAFVRLSSVKCRTSGRKHYLMYA